MVVYSHNSRSRSLYTEKISPRVETGGALRTVLKRTFYLLIPGRPMRLSVTTLKIDKL